MLTCGQLHWVYDNVSKRMEDGQRQINLQLSLQYRLVEDIAATTHLLCLKQQRIDSLRADLARLFGSSFCRVGDDAILAQVTAGDNMGDSS